MSDILPASNGAEIVEVVRRHHREYINGSDGFLQYLAFPLLVRRRGVSRSYLSSESYAGDAKAHRQSVVSGTGLTKAGFRTEAVVSLGFDLACVRFHSLRLNNSGAVLSAHAANFIVTRCDNRWRISAIFADDNPLDASTQVVELG